MPKFRIAGVNEKAKGIYYEFDSDDRPLGEGGMGKVYKGNCVNERSGQSYVVAVKFLKEEAANNPYVVEKARREAEMPFTHDNLIKMYGFVVTEEKTPYDFRPIRHYHVVSELLMGISLADLLAGRLVDQEGKYMLYAETLYKEYQQAPERFAIKIIKRVLSGLMCMHDAGYIHRDIDPSNVMITSDGKIKLIDYGIAKKMNALTTSDKHMTQAGEFVGKPEFAAPELILGAINEQNQTTDIYAVGILLFQCIVGRLPFEGERLDIIQKQLNQQPPLNLVKNKELRKIIKCAMQKKRADRFQSSAEFRVELDKLRFDDDSNPVPIKKYIIGAVAALVLIVGGVVLFNAIDPDEPKPVINDDTIPKPILISTPVPKKITVCDATALLHDAATAEKGYSELQKLAETNSEAAYILSRIHFKNMGKTQKAREEKLPDSILNFQQNLQDASITFVNADKAHDLLKKAVELDETNIYAQYELGLDYYLANGRTDAVKEPKFSEAKKCFDSVIQSKKDPVLTGKAKGYIQTIEKNKLK